MKMTDYQRSVCSAFVVFLVLGFVAVIVGGLQIVIPAILTVGTSLLGSKKFRAPILWGTTLVTNLGFLVYRVWRISILGAFVATFASLILTILAGLVGFQVFEVCRQLCSDKNKVQALIKAIYDNLGQLLVLLVFTALVIVSYIWFFNEFGLVTAVVPIVVVAGFFFNLRKILEDNSSFVRIVCTSWIYGGAITSILLGIIANNVWVWFGASLLLFAGGFLAVVIWPFCITCVFVSLDNDYEIHRYEGRQFDVATY